MAIFSLNCTVCSKGMALTSAVNSKQVRLAVRGEAKRLKILLNTEYVRIPGPFSTMPLAPYIYMQASFELCPTVWWFYFVTSVGYIWCGYRVCTCVYLAGAHVCTCVCSPVCSDTEVQVCVCACGCTHMYACNMPMSNYATAPRVLVCIQPGMCVC